jgi:polyhydroxyalkanoate synthesis regulator phasin
MSNPVVHAFFVGRALAEAVNQQLENALTNTLSELGKFDAEQKERWRQFTQEVMERAERDAAATGTQTSDPASGMPSGAGDLQATIDELRAEIARLRAELQRYRNRTL